MTRFFQVIYLGLVVLGSVPSNLFSQTDLARQSIGLSPADSILVQKSLQLIPKDNYTYVVVHGVGSTFKILEGNFWNTITDQSLASRIASKCIDPKPIVLLSCSDTTATQNLANALAKLDTSANPKRTMRPVIGWDGDVVLFENGTIQGYGACRLFSAAIAGQKIPTARFLSDPAIPLGTNQPISDGMASVTLARPLSPEGNKIDDLRINGQPLPLEQRNVLLDAWRDTKVDLIHAYYEDITIITPTKLKKPKGTINDLSTIFGGWLFLKWDCNIKPTPITGDYEVLVSAKAISDKSFYKQNLKNVQTIFRTYLQTGKEPVATLKKLKDATHENDFITIIQQAGTRTSLSTLFGAAPLTPLEKNLQILKTVAAQAKFVAMMNAYESDKTKVPVNTLGMTLDLLKALRTTLSVDFIKGRNYVEDVLPLITPVVNQTIGQGISYTDMLLLTQKGSVMEHSAIKGSIFEHWGMQQHNQVEYGRLKTYVLL